MTASARSRLARGSLDGERIIDTAFEIANEVGLANLNMNLLATRLDVGVTSIYWHIRNRDELIRQMAARAVLRLDQRLPSPEELNPSDWAQFLTDYFMAQRRLFAEDDLLGDLIAARYAKHGTETTDLSYRGIEKVLRYLVAAGFEPVDSWNLYSSLWLYTQGFAVVERRSRASGIPRSSESQLEVLDPEATPIIVGLLRAQAISLDLVGDATFEAGLNWLIGGAASSLSA